jgi:hypothetical protein
LREAWKSKCARASSRIAIFWARMVLQIRHMNRDR